MTVRCDGGRTAGLLIRRVSVAAALTLGALPPVRLAAQDSAPPPARLWAPGAVQQRAPTTPRDNDSLVQAIEKQIRCTCGCNLDVYTCRTTDFTCTTSPAMHRSVLARLDSALEAGYDQAQAARVVLAGFEQQYGQQVFMAPPRRGFNWSAYVMPFAALAFGIVLLVWLMRRWIRGRPAEPVAEGTAPLPEGIAPDEAARLERELERFEA